MSHLPTLSDYIGNIRSPLRKQRTTASLAQQGDAVKENLSLIGKDETDMKSSFEEASRALKSKSSRIARIKKIIKRNLHQSEEPDQVNDAVSVTQSGLLWSQPSLLDRMNTQHDSDTDLEVEDAPDSYDHSGKTAYVEACQKNRVVPVSYYMRHMQDTELKLRHHQLGWTGVKPIAVSLVSNAKIVSLDLTDNYLTHRGAEVICNMLRENCFITHLNLSENHLGSESAELLANALQTSISLTHVTLSANGFDDRAAEYFAEAILNSTKLEYLDLSHNSFAELGGAAFGPAIGENTSIKELNLSWNSLRRKGAVAIARGIQNNIMLRTLKLAWNGFGVEGCREMGRALMDSSTLEELDLTNNRITTEAAVLLGKGVAVSESLHTLKVGLNPMQSAGCWAICSAVLKNPHQMTKELDFEGILVNNDFYEVLAEVYKSLPNIVVTHGGSEPPKKPKAMTHPLIKVQNFIKKHNLKLIDFFQKFDTHGSMSVSHQEFAEGLEELGIKLLREEVDILIHELDKDGGGEINYSELVTGNQEFTEKEVALATLRVFQQVSGGSNSILKSTV